MTERWRRVRRAPNYEVSDEGRLRNTTTGRILSPPTCNRGKGYHRMIVRVDGHPWALSVHTEVLRAFVGERPHGKECGHLNGDCRDNRLENLAWITAKENAAHRVLHGHDNRGKKNGNAKLSADQVQWIRAAYRPRHPYFGGKAIAQRMGVDPTTVYAVMKRQNWAWLGQSDAGAGQ